MDIFFALLDSYLMSRIISKSFLKNVGVDCMKKYRLIGIPEFIANPLAWMLAWFIAFFLWLGVPILFFVFIKPLWRSFVAVILYYALFISVRIKTAPWFERKAREFGLVDDDYPD
jgi:hypothetical protein